MDAFLPYLTPIQHNAASLLERVMAWSAINSGSTHIAGLARMSHVLWEAFAPLSDTQARIPLPASQRLNKNAELEPLPLGDVLRFRTRPEAPIQILLVGHYDTVFGEHHPFQTPKLLDDGILNGPGVADLKGGLVVMHAALSALEASPWKERIGWEVILNPDEEIGSPGSAPILAEAATHHQLGLVYEPAMADGVLAGARKGSGNFTWVVRGRAAHAGRDIEAGRNAIVALAELTLKLAAKHGFRDGLTINPGVSTGGTVVNTVPDLATLAFNIRMKQPDDMHAAEAMLSELEAELKTRDGLSIERHGHFTRPPKPMSTGMQALFEALAECGNLLGIPIRWRDSGGVCDGNNLAASGLPNVDTLGVVGGNLHSAEEFMRIASLVERAQLSALLLLRLASGELAVPKKE